MGIAVSAKLFVSLTTHKSVMVDIAFSLVNLRARCHLLTFPSTFIEFLDADYLEF